MSFWIEHFEWVATISCCGGFFLALSLDPVAVMVLAILAGYGFAIAPRTDSKVHVFDKKTRRATSTSHGGSVTSQQHQHNHHNAGSVSMTHLASPSQSSVFGELPSASSLSDAYAYIYEDGKLIGKAPAFANAAVILAAYPGSSALIRCQSNGDFMLDPGKMLSGNSQLGGGLAYRLVKGNEQAFLCMKCGEKFVRSKLLISSDGQFICKKCYAVIVARKKEKEREESKPSPSLISLPYRATKFVVGLPFRPVKWIFS